jgi:DNA-binding beta-propeller fold protein YncE
VIGVHSPKFIGERLTESVQQAIQRLNVGHPVVNDCDFRVWKAYAARAWPTLMFIDPQGKVIGKHEGEFPLEPFDQLIAEMVAEFDASALLDRRPLDLSADCPVGVTPLLFPGKLIADEATGHLIISDTGHHRLIVADLNGQVRQVVGSGAQGFDDGPAEVATFSHPQGLALDGATLYVADTENHALRAVDLTAGTVLTVAGTGEQRMGPRVGGPAIQTALSSPWDLALLDGTLYVAMAGTHQLWSMELGSGFVVPHTGTGREDLVDGPLGEASMNQPSGLATDGMRLYVADSEASAIRVVEPGTGGTIRTIVGEGLFEFGDRDGRGPAEVRLQHPVGVTWHDGVVHVADTYNHKIKRLDPVTAECRSWLGRGEPGLEDGDADAIRFSEPSGLAVAAGRLYIADTNNHAVRVADLATGAVTTLQLSGLPLH